MLTMTITEERIWRDFYCVPSTLLRCSNSLQCLANIFFKDNKTTLFKNKKEQDKT